MRTNLEEIQRTEQTDGALTKIKARGEQRIECSKRRPRTSVVAAAYACRCANLRPKSGGPKGVCGVVGRGPGANAIWAKLAPLKHRFAVIAPTVSPSPEPSSHRMTQLVFGALFECCIFPSDSQIVNIDLYYLGIARKNAAFEKGSENELRHTVGGRFWGGRNGWSYNSEAMFQWGEFGPNGIRAWATTHDTAYTFRSTALRPQVGATAGIASGNHGGSGSPLGTFNPLFPTGFYFGQGGVSLLGPLNLFEVGPHVSVQLTRSLSVVADDHTFWRTSLQDGVYGLGINLLVSGQGNSGRYIGNQPSVGVYWNAGRHLSVSTAYAHFLVGTFLAKASPPGRDVDYAAVWTTYKF